MELAKLITGKSASCADGVANGSESDVDCGGSCDGCATGAACAQGSDCESGVCTASVCSAPTCTDGVQNGSETDEDCGGDSCTGCALAAGCIDSTDCASGYCLHGLCAMGEYVLGTPIHEVGVGRFSFAAGDFDGDGHTDVLSANSDDTLGWLKGNGDGSFAPAELITLYPELSSVNAADLDDDGIADAIVTSRLGAVTVLRGSPAGPGSPIDYQAEVPTISATGDVDGDGHLDVMFDDANTKTASVLLNDGAGNLSDGGAFDLHPAAGVPSWTVACMELVDLDKDGDVDLLFLTDQSSLYLMRNSGGGQFDEPVYNTMSSVYGKFALADMNEDSNLDLVGGGVTSLNVLLGDGTGMFTHHSALSSYGTSLGIVTGDFDGDGHADVAVNHEHSTAHPMSGITIIRGLGDGTLSPSLDVRAGTHPVGLVATDLQGDGITDLLVNNNGTFWDWDHRFGANISVHIGGPGGTYPTFPVYQFGDDYMRVASGDLDQDGDQDAVVARWGDSEYDGELTVLLNSGGVLEPGVQYAAGSMVSSVSIGDLTGDGVPDLFSTDIGGQQLNVLAGLGDVTFAAASPLDNALLARDGTLADIDGDGRLDLVWTIRSVTGNLVGTRRSFGGGAFGSTQWWGAPADSPRAVEAGDLTGNGRPDLVVPTYGDEYGNDSKLVVLRNQGGSFTSTSTYDAAYGANGATIADFDGDGLQDVAVAYGETSHVGIRLNEGNGQLGSEAYYPVHPRTIDIASADFNGDGRPDIALIHWSSASVSILINEGGTFGPTRHYLAGEKPISIDVAFMDGDATNDLLVTSEHGLGLLMGQIR